MANNKKEKRAIASLVLIELEKILRDEPIVENLVGPENEWCMQTQQIIAFHISNCSNIIRKLSEI